MKCVSIRQNKDIKEKALLYIKDKWASETSMMMFDDCINHSIETKTGLPNWYVLLDGDDIIGCAGLITNDFISRMDLYPWLSSLYIDKSYRGKNLGKLLIDRIIEDTKALGFESLYLCTDHIGYYEKYGFSYLAEGYHPWGEKSSIYQMSLA